MRKLLAFHHGMLVILILALVVRIPAIEVNAVEDYFPLTVGNSWIYTWRNTYYRPEPVMETLTVSASDSLATINAYITKQGSEASGQFNIWKSSDSLYSMGYSTSGSDPFPIPMYMILYYVGPFHGMVKLLPVPLDVGVTWAWTAPSPFPGRYPEYIYFSASSIATGFESVSVPAGTFSCILVESTITAWTDSGSSGSNYLSGTREMWFADGVGLVKLVYDHADGSVTEAMLQAMIPPGTDNESPTITVTTPTDEGLYSTTSGALYSFFVTDDLDPNPRVVAIETDYFGNSRSVSPGYPLPSTPGLYTLTVTAKDCSGNPAMRSVEFTVFTVAEGDYFPLALGDSWIYVWGNTLYRPDPVTETLTVSAIADGNAIISADITRPDSEAHLQFIISRFSDALYWSGYGGGGGWDPFPIPMYMILWYTGPMPDKFLTVPLSLGDPWTWTGTYPGRNEYIDYYASSTFVGFESVTVPAGTFSCVVVETAITATTGSSSGRDYLSGTREMWFADGVGLVKLVYHHADGSVTEGSLTEARLGPADSDGDGIADSVDTEPAAFSSDFSDVGTGGTTAGTIITRGDQTLTITEEPNPAGVRIGADASGGAGNANVNVCEAVSLSLSAGDEVLATCGSATVEVITGTVEISFLAADGTVATAGLSEGNGVTFQPETFTFAAAPTNSGSLSILVGGAEFSLTPGEEMLFVKIDIKPGSYPNSFNNNGKGVIPVAILGSAALDVTRIDPDSVRLEGLAVKAAGKGSKLLAHIEDVNTDGFMDLVVQIQDNDGVFSPGTTVARLSGKLIDGTLISGIDTISIVP